MTSDEMNISYAAIHKRAQNCALEYMPEMPKQNTFEAWESFQQDVEALDAYEIAHESADWDWVIYYHRALELCQAVPSGILHEAESEYNDCGGFGDIDIGLYELATHLAHLIVSRAIREAVEDAKEEMIDLAETQMESF